MTAKKIDTADAVVDSVAGEEEGDHSVRNLSGCLEGLALQEQGCSRLRALLLDGADSTALAAADDTYFAGLREYIAGFSDAAS